MQPLARKSPWVFGRFEKVTDGKWAAAQPLCTEEPAAPRRVTDDGLRILTACKITGEGVKISHDTRVVDLTIDQNRISRSGVERSHCTSGGSSRQKLSAGLDGATQSSCGVTQPLKIREQDGHSGHLDQPEEKIRSFQPKLVNPRRISPFSKKTLPFMT